jgi:hypothetical protein
LVGTLNFLGRAVLFDGDAPKFVTILQSSE